MVSKDDRNAIRSLTGIGSTSKDGSSIIPEYAARWKGTPNPVKPSSTPPVPAKRTSVTNPYDSIANPAATLQRLPLSTPAKQTFLNGLRAPTQGFGPGRYSHPISTSGNKGKGKAVERRRRSPSEPIDVDASTDDLNVLDREHATTSSYFDSKQEPRSQEGVRKGSLSGATLVEDGPYTKNLKSKITNGGRVSPQEIASTHQRPETSPIQNYSDEEVKELPQNQLFEGASSVREKVAKIEGIGKKDNQENPLKMIRIIDFKNPPLKSRMQPKGGGRKLPLTISADVLSEPSGLHVQLGRSKLTSKSSSPLPISTLRLGIQELRDRSVVILDDAGRRYLKFEGGPEGSVGPIPITPHYMTGFQCTDPEALDDTFPPVFCFSTSSTASFRQWEPYFNSNVFKPGAKHRGQICMKFNTSNAGWDKRGYREAVNAVSRSLGQKEVLRPRASKSLWNTLTYDADFDSGDSTDAGALYNDGESEDALILSLEQQPPAGSPQYQADIAMVSSSTGNRPSPPDHSIRKRSSQPDQQVTGNSEVSVVERPPKRQRVEEPKPLRRSTRRQEKSPSNDLDEVILVYPYRVPGAVNITAGDLARLQPEEFLNDTLIEFGLKSWLRELEITNPDVASQVHVFNSFFYKKLNKRNIKEGYESVRKWTSKIDIFSKKCIVIPINESLHWYLAIIYEPEHTLRTPPINIPHTNAVTRRQAREMQAAGETVEAEAKPANSRPQASPVVFATLSSGDEDATSETNSETEVERLTFLTNCSVTTTNESSSMTNHASELKDELIRASTSRKKTPELVPGSPMQVDSDLGPATSEQTSKSEASDAAMSSGVNTPLEIFDDSQPNKPVEVVTPARFYGKSYSTKPRKKTRESMGDPVILDDVARTKIFIFDSLGNRHGQAMKQLNKWLEFEAIDKKKVESVTPAIDKMVPVPVQPNFCDCGLYVLHFAKTFVSNHQHYSQLIMTKERPTMVERQEDWKSESVSGMRSDLQAQIIRYSEEWQLARAQEEEIKKQQQQNSEGEDSDVAIIEHVKANGRKGKASKSARRKPE